jgi:hypothetical protein
MGLNEQRLFSLGEIPLEFDGARFQFVEGPERSTGPVNATQVRRPRPVMS